MLSKILKITTPLTLMRNVTPCKLALVSDLHQDDADSQHYRNLLSLNG